MPAKKPGPKKSSAKSSSKKVPWDKKNPVKKHKKLTTSEKTEAKSRAKKAGRPYPNMVDSMTVAKKKKK